MTASFSTESLLARFHTWFGDAATSLGDEAARAMVLATAGQNAAPSCRVVLLRGADAEGFVWFTNRTSQKGHELAENAQAALCFYWPSLKRQWRAEGQVVHTSDVESDAYFAQRTRESQLGAWASEQSTPIPDRDALMLQLAQMDARYAGRPVPRPPHWGGYRLVPQRMEFWEEGAHRLHTRELFTRQANGQWQRTMLAP